MKLKEGFVPLGVVKYEAKKIADSKEAFDRAGMDFLPGIMSQGGVVGAQLQEFIELLAAKGARAQAVREYIGARTERQAEGTLRHWFRTHLAARHASAKGRHIEAYYRSFIEVGGRVATGDAQADGGARWRGEREEAPERVRREEMGLFAAMAAAG